LGGFFHLGGAGGAVDVDLIGFFHENTAPFLFSCKHMNNCSIDEFIIAHRPTLVNGFLKNIMEGRDALSAPSGHLSLAAWLRHPKGRGKLGSALRQGSA
jgi:hypothetical protein